MFKLFQAVSSMNKIYRCELKMFDRIHRIIGTKDAPIYLLPQREAGDGEIFLQPWYSVKLLYIHFPPLDF